MAFAELNRYAQGDGMGDGAEGDVRGGCGWLRLGGAWNDESDESDAGYGGEAIGGTVVAAGGDGNYAAEAVDRDFGGLAGDAERGGALVY